MVLCLHLIYSPFQTRHKSRLSHVNVFTPLWRTIKNREGVHLTLPPHILSVQVKSRSMLHYGSVGGEFKIK